MAPIHGAALGPSALAKPSPADGAPPGREGASTSPLPWKPWRLPLGPACSFHGCSSFLSIPTWYLIHTVEVTLERVDVDRPEAAERSEPGVYLHEWLGPDPVKTPL